MTDWITVARTDEIADKQWKVIQHNTISIIIINLAGQFYALENVCPHNQSPLAGEPIEDDIITCPRHGARFNIKTGGVLCPPAYEAVTTFPVRISGDEVQINIDA